MLLHKPAALVQAHGATLHFIASNKLDLGVRVIALHKILHLQTEPAALRIELQLKVATFEIINAAISNIHGPINR